MKYNERDRALFWMGFMLGWGMGILYVVVLTVVFKP